MATMPVAQEPAGECEISLWTADFVSQNLVSRFRWLWKHTAAGAWRYWCNNCPYSERNFEDITYRMDNKFPDQLSNEPCLVQLVFMAFLMASCFFLTSPSCFYWLSTSNPSGQNQNLFFFFFLVAMLINQLLLHRIWFEWNGHSDTDITWSSEGPAPHVTVDITDYCYMSLTVRAAAEVRQRHRAPSLKTLRCAYWCGPRSPH